MKSNICYFYNENGIEDVLDEIEKTARYCGFSNKQTLQLRLLSEELIGMIQVMKSEFEGQFWIETGIDSCDLHMLMDVLFEDDEIKDELKNIAEINKKSKSLVGDIYEFIVNVMAGKKARTLKPNSPMVRASFTGLGTVNWSLSSYKRVLKETGNSDEIDFLDKSIIGKLSDDILLSTRDNQVELIIKKDFYNE